jgi:subtilisin family serine protease
MQVQRLMPPPGMDAATAREILGQQSNDKSIQLNELYRPIRAAASDAEDGPPQKRLPHAASTGGCNAERCFAMKAIRWDAQLHHCTRGVDIGIIDTIIDVQHPNLHAVLAEKRIATRSFIGKGRTPAMSSHGTGILSLLAGGTDSGTPGLLPHARFSVADIFHADAGGQPFADTLSLLRALDWMDEKNIKVVNMSVAGPHDPLMERAIDKLTRKGVIFVAAAGNEGPTAPPMYPAAYSNVIAVTAVARDLRGYRRANRGEYIDAAAPGVDVWTALPDAKESYQSGTSFAVPFATAVVATVYNQVKAKTKESVLAAIQYKDLGLPGRDTVFGRGLILAPDRCEAPDSNIARAAPPGLTPAAAATLPMPASASAATPGISFGFASGRP